MREIKFRVYTNSDGMVYSDVDCFVSLNNDGSLNNSGVYTHHVMQYTGIKDKNGKEIYEGDIIATIHKDRVFDGSIIRYLHYEINEVLFADGAFVTSEDDDISIGKWITDCECEVIGNIHENPELLKE